MFDNLTTTHLRSHGPRPVSILHRGLDCLCRIDSNYYVKYSRVYSKTYKVPRRRKYSLKLYKKMKQKKKKKINKSISKHLNTDL